MSPTVDIRVLHLLCSRLCHDLVGPVGAISNGLELIREFDSADTEALELVGGSAAQLSARLQLYRVAYGMATGAARSVAEMRALVEPWCRLEDVALSWPNGPVDGSALTLRGIKVVLNLIVLGRECLVRQGSLTVALEPKGDTLAAIVTAEGPGAKLKDEIAEGLEPTLTPDELTPRTVQGFYTRALVEADGQSITVDTGPDRVIFASQVALDG